MRSQRRTPSISTSCWILAAALLQSVVICSAQQRPLYVDPPTANFTSQRHDVCSRNAAYMNGTVELRNALEGMQLYPLLYATNYYLNLDDTGRINEDSPGLLAEILDEVATRGGFNWRDSFAIVTVVPNETTVDDYLVWGVDKFDWATAFFTITVDRLRRGLDFPEGWLDDFLIVVTTSNSKEEETQWLFWNWTRPFSPAVWASIFVTCAVTGILYYLLEIVTNLANKPKQQQQQRQYKATTARKTGQKVTENMLLSAMICTGQGGVGDYWTESFPTKLLLGSMGIFGLLLSATYTANLASFYVVENVQKVQFNSINDVIDAGLPICVMKDTYGDIFLSKNFPKAIRVRGLYEKDMFRGLRDHECAAAVCPSITFELYKRDKNFNGDCQLQKLGAPLDAVQEGFAFKVDLVDRCTSLVQAVFNVHLKEMARDGFIKQTFDTYQQESQTVSCFDNSGTQDNQGDSMTLTFYQLAGTFLLHGMMTGVAIFLAIVTCICQVAGRSSSKRNSNFSSDMEGSEPNGHPQRVAESKNDIGAWSSPYTQEGTLQHRQNVELRLAEMERNMAEITPLLKRLCLDIATLSEKQNNNMDGSPRLPATSEE